MTADDLVMSDAEFRMIAEFLRGSCGLHFGNESRYLLERRIARRCAELGMRSFTAYHYALRNDATGEGELGWAIDNLTTNETYFLRERRQLEALIEEIVPAVQARRGGSGTAPVSVWSAGCSSGEEPYTIAMLCAEAAAAAGHAAWTERVRITATDIDRESLERARNAVYPQASFLEAPAWITEKYCEREGESWRVREDIRRMVTITRLDLTREAIPAAAYDLIFCRNVVIYFDRPMQERLFAQFADALLPGGILVLGKVETLLGVAREKLTLVDARERIFRRAA